jgi:hypothetical protein
MYITEQIACVMDLSPAFRTAFFEFLDRQDTSAGLVFALGA